MSEAWRGLTYKEKFAAHTCSQCSKGHKAVLIDNMWFHTNLPEHGGTVPCTANVHEEE